MRNDQWGEFPGFNNGAPAGGPGLGQSPKTEDDHSASGTKGRRQARVLDDGHIERIIKHIREISRSPLSDELKFVLSVFAGLRAGEIAGLTIDDLVDADDKITDRIVVRADIAKGKRQRIIPMHPRVRDALVRFRKAHPYERNICISRRGRQNVEAVTKWFNRLFSDISLKGCSSHSGRRTFITNLARMANLHGHSLRDVQALAGHSRLDTTAAYIDHSEDLAGLVAALGAPASGQTAPGGAR
jgi:integrase